MSHYPGAYAASQSNGESGSNRPGRLRAYRKRRRAKKALRSKLRRRLTRTGIGLGLFIVIVAGGGGGFVYYQLHRIHTVAVPNLTHETTVSGAATDILLVGSTSRCAVTSSKYLKNFNDQCQAGVNGVNSDVIMILRLQPGKSPSLLSIPRDTFVPDARAGGLYNKIDAALADGPSQLVAAIQQDFGIPINHYVVLNFGTFANIVTALGGITMYFPTTLYDSQSGLYISHSGCLHISGLEALALVRARHLNYHYDPATKTWLGYDPSGDIGRIERVHIFLKVLASEVAQRGLSNPITDTELLAALAPDLTVDTTLTTSEMAHLVLDYHSKVGNAPEYTLPIVEDSTNYDYMGYDYGLIVFPTEPQDQETISTFLGNSPTPPAPSSFTLSVVDGTGSSSATEATATALGALGFHVIGTSSQEPVGPISETTIAYTQGHLTDAEAVKSELSGTVVLAEAATADGADVSVVTGSDLNVAAPAAASTAAVTSTSSGGSSILATLLSAVLDADATTTTTTTTLPAVDAPLSPATPAVSAVPAYDPRACPATTSSSKKHS